jgi:hypothetical protein
LIFSYEDATKKRLMSWKKDYDNMKSCILVPARDIQDKPRHWLETNTPFTITAKHAWELEKITSRI